jgi:sporulation protein YabP
LADHLVTMTNRNQVELSGVTNVVTFDEEAVILETTMGLLVIMGEQLHITMLNLDQSKVAVEGNIAAMEYKAQGTDLKARSKSILNRLLK